MEKKKVRKVNSNTNTMKVQTTEQSELKSFLIVIGVVVLCVLGLWLVTDKVVNKEKEEEKKEQEVVGSINYDVASVGTMFNRREETYYAVIYDVTGDKAYDMSVLISAYKAKEKALHMYVVDLNDHMNKKYYDPEKVDTKVKSYSDDIRFGDITLVKIKNGKIVKYIVDYSKMESELGV